MSRAMQVSAISSYLRFKRVPRKLEADIVGFLECVTPRRSALNRDQRSPLLRPILASTYLICEIAHSRWLCEQVPSGFKQQDGGQHARPQGAARHHAL